MSKNISAIRGMKDILPSETPLWHWFENTMSQVLLQYGYHEIRMPMVEMTALYKRSVGEATDIVEKETYSFTDRNGDELTLRPEGTAGCMRAGIEHSLFYNQAAKLWYMGPLFRHERPQKGRYRQFNQLGVEVCGLSTPQTDAEVILLSARLLKTLGLFEHVTLELNTLGSGNDRAKYRDILVDYFTQHHDKLDEDSQRRLSSNPLRILDSKNPDMAELIANAPKITEHLSAEAQHHFSTVCDILQQAGINYTLKPTLVRGLDYYCHTVFEWVTDALGAQGTVCAGGRYDGLIEQLGGKPTPGIGFAMGVERALLLMEDLNLLPDYDQEHPDLYVFSPNNTSAALALCEQLRDSQPTLRITCGLNEGSMKSHMKKADKSQAKAAIILGEQEMTDGTVTIKPLDGGEQTTIAQKELSHWLLHSDLI